MASNKNEHSNSKSIWHPDLQELHIDFSPLLNTPCTLILTSWQRGISWSVIVDDQIEHHTDPFEDSLFPIEFVDHYCLKQWVQTIPIEILNLLRRYKGNMFGMMNIVSRHETTLNLFLKNPTVFWQLFRHAEENDWTEIQFIDCCKQY